MNAKDVMLARALGSGGGGADGKSAYQYAVEGGYTGTEAEFAAKMAEEIPDKLPNPHALTFTGAVTGSYDGSAPMEVEIPGEKWYEKEILVTEEVASIEETLTPPAKELQISALDWRCTSKDYTNSVQLKINNEFAGYVPGLMESSTVDGRAYMRAIICNVAGGLDIEQSSGSAANGYDFTQLKTPCRPVRWLGDIGEFALKCGNYNQRIKAGAKIKIRWR